jgi:hypothetical protein
VDSSLLVTPPKRDSLKLLERLDAAGVPIVAAYWYWDPEPESDRLLLVSPAVEEEGSLKLYGAIQRALRAHPPLALNLSEVTVMAPSAELVKALSGAVSGPSPALSMASVARGPNGPVFDVIVLRPLQDTFDKLGGADQGKRARRTARSK